MKRFALLFVLIACLPLVVLAGIDMETYREIPTNGTLPSENVTGATSAAALTVDTPSATYRGTVAGNTTVCVQADLSGSAGDTVAITFIPYHFDGSSTYTRLPGLQTVTVTAGAFTDAAGDNICPAAFFEVPAGATHYEIRHAAPSAGNVDLTWIAYGVNPTQ